MTARTPGRRVTIMDVAARAGVSKSSVSFAFNEPGKLAPATLTSILKAADELGYMRDPAAAALRTGRTAALGVLLPQRIDHTLANPYYAQFLRGVGQTCHTHGLSMLVVPPLYGSVLKAIPMAAVDGFVVSGLESDKDEVLALLARNVPFVLVDSEETPGVTTIDVDEAEAMRTVTAHLLARGHRDLLLLAFESATPGEVHRWRGTLARRIAGVREALRAVGSDLDDPRVQVREAVNSREGAADALRAAWASGARPTAVLCFSDVLAVGVLGAARELGIDVPGELSVTGFDDLPESAWTTPPLTTVRQPTVEKGRLASEYLVDAIAGAPERPRTHLHAELVVRASVAPPRA